MNTFTKLTSALVLGLSFCMAGNATETTNLQELEAAYNVASAKEAETRDACWEVAYEILNTPTNMQFLRDHADVLQKYSCVDLLREELDGILYCNIMVDMARETTALTSYGWEVFEEMSKQCHQAFDNAGPAYEAFKSAIAEQIAAWKALCNARQAAKTAKEQ